MKLHLLNAYRSTPSRRRAVLASKMMGGTAVVALAAGLLQVPTAATAAAAMEASTVADISIASTKVLDLGFDGDLTDASTNAFPVSMQSGTASYATGIDGQAFNFDGAAALNLGTSAKLQPVDLTLSYWFKPNVAMGTGEQVFAWSKSVYNSDGWYLSSENASTPLALSVGPSSGQPYKVAVSSDRATFFPTGQWTHVVVTYDSASKAITFYRNGVRQNSVVKYAVSATASGVLGSESTTTKTMGYNGPTYHGSFLDGAIDDYRLYNGVATASDVVTLTQENNPSFDPATVANSDLSAVSIPSSAISDLALPTVGQSGSDISWTSSNDAVIAVDGATAKVHRPDSGEPVDVVLTASSTYAGSTPVTKQFTVSVIPTSTTATSIYLADSGLSNVDVTDPYLVNANHKTIKYLLSLDPEKFLYSWYLQAGLQPTTSSGYGGWEQTTGTRFQGHFFGHYISALSQAYAATTDPDTKAQLLTKLTSAVDGLKKAQDAYAALDATNAGYVAPFPVTALPDGADGLLVPFYNLHKVLAGLLDAHDYAPSDVAATALSVADKFGTWVTNWAGRQADPTKVFNTEYGGMNEALYRLYSYTKNPVHKRAAEYFDETALFQKLANNQDVLAELHANATIPKVIGALKRYTVFTDNPDLYATLTDSEKANLNMYLQAAQNFWQMVVTTHSYANGGNSQAEHFHAVDTLYAYATNGVTSGYGENSTSEGCNEYNMLKLSRALFKVTKDAKYPEFYESTYTNAIVASQNPNTGMVTYFQPMAAGYSKIFGTPLDQFWCDHGSGVESFTKLGDSIYFTDATSVYVNMFRSSTYTDTRHNLVLTQSANVPDEQTVRYTVAGVNGGDVKAGTQLRLRVPGWVNGSPTLTINGVTQNVDSLLKGGYLVFDVHAGDQISYNLPPAITVDDHTENSNWVAFKYGPVLLATRLSTRNANASYTAGVLVQMSVADKSLNSNVVVDNPPTWKQNIATNLERLPDVTGADGISRMQFKLRNVDDQAAQFVFEPYYSLYDARYAIYMTLVQPDSPEAQAQILKQKEQQRVAETTIDSLTTFDNNNNEADKNYKFNKSSVGVYKGEGYRDAQNTPDAFFQYEMKVDPSLAHNYLGVRYYGGDNGRTFDLYLNDTLLKHETVTNANGSTTWYIQYDEIPRTILDGIAAKDSYKKDVNGNYILDEAGHKVPVVTVRFQGNGTSYVGGVYGVYTAASTSYDTTAELKSLSFSSGWLNPALKSGVYSYTLAVAKDATSVDMNVAPAIGSGLVYVDDILIDDSLPRRLPLNADQTTLTLKSYAQDHTTYETYTISIQRSGAVAPTALAISPDTVAPLPIGATATLTASITPAAADQSVTWSSSDTNVATVSDAGVVRAVAAGTATITARSSVDANIAAAVSVTVSAKPKPKTLTAPRPGLSGVARVGSTLTVATGTWQPAPVSFSYRWFRSGSPIPGATSTKYALTAADLGKTIWVEVTGTKDGYDTAIVTSAPTTKVAPGKLSASRPTILGRAKVGKALRAVSGSWAPGVRVTYQWSRSGRPIKGAHAVTYRLRKADRGQKIRVTVTASANGYDTYATQSNPTKRVR